MREVLAAPWLAWEQRCRRMGDHDAALTVAADYKAAAEVAAHLPKPPPEDA